MSDDTMRPSWEEVAETNRRELAAAIRFAKELEEKNAALQAELDALREAVTSVAGHTATDVERLIKTSRYVLGRVGMHAETRELLRDALAPFEATQ